MRMGPRALPLLLLLLLTIGSPPPSAHLRLRSYYGDTTTPSSLLFVDAAPTHYNSDPALVGSDPMSGNQYVAINGDAISGDLDFDFELGADDSERETKGEIRTEDDIMSHQQQQQLTEVELLDAAQGGDLSFKKPSLHNIAPKTFNFGRGVGYIATRGLKSQELLFTLPMSEIMTLESAKRGRVGALLAANPGLPPAIALALHLLEEHFLGVKSNFSSLIESFPSAEALNSSMFYSREELELLQGSQLLRAIATRAKALESFFEVLVEPVTSLAMDPPLFAQHEFTTANFKWAMGVVWSHAFPIGDGLESDVVLAPVLSTIGVCVADASGGDMAGMTKCPRSRMEVIPSANTQQLVVYAARDYAPGDEIRLFMGDKSSTMLMANHGFTRPLSSHPSSSPPQPTITQKMTATPDQVDLAILLDADDPLAEVKGFLLSTQNMTMNDSYVLSYDSHELPGTLLTSLRIKLLSGSEITRFKDLFGPAKDAKEPYAALRHIVGLRNEFVATRALLLACKNLLAQYPTSLEDDEVALAGMEQNHHEMASREAQIRRMLVLEKRILHHAIEIAKHQWADLVLLDHPNLLRGE